MRHPCTGAKRCAILAVLVIGLQAAPPFLSSSQAQSAQPAGKAKESKVADPDLERMKYELEKRRVGLEAEKNRIEREKMADARYDAVWTKVSIAVPILIGFFTLWWQARTAFRLKAVEVILGSKSTQAGKERARALHRLFPRDITDDFLNVFDTEKFKLPGIAYQEKKLELFKALSGNYDKRREIFRTYAMLYADEALVVTEFLDKWRNLYPEDKEWVDGFTAHWKTAFPEGKWKKKDEEKEKKSSSGQPPARP